MSSITFDSTVERTTRAAAVASAVRPAVHEGADINVVTGAVIALALIAVLAMIAIFAAIAGSMATVVGVSIATVVLATGTAFYLLHRVGL